ncbi:MAG: prolyl oligopeptidase family serine peptidase [Bacteroidales bacterium]|nr:prolyl oligopeptidase family serine peptidase [Bacteroidales bacterium]
MKKVILLSILFQLFGVKAGAQQQMVIKTSNYTDNDTVNYYLPDGFSIKEKYPAVILLHGYGGNYKQWGNICDLQSFANEFGMILICPDGYKESWYIDSPIKKNLKYATFFKDDLLPNIKKRLPVDTTSMFITGLSMGGHGALYLFLQNHTEFRAVGSISGVLDLRYSSVANTSLAKLIGAKTKQNSNWEKYSVIHHLDILKDSGKPIIVNCGAQDFLIEINRKFAKQCSQSGIEIVYTESPGKHEREYWKRVLPEQLRFFRRFINKNIN